MQCLRNISMIFVLLHVETPGKYSVNISICDVRAITLPSAPLYHYSFLNPGTSDRETPDKKHFSIKLFLNPDKVSTTRRYNCDTNAIQNRKSSSGICITHRESIKHQVNLQIVDL